MNTHVPDEYAGDYAAAIGSANDELFVKYASPPGMKLVVAVRELLQAVIVVNSIIIQLHFSAK